jgi:hypothetical protein
MTLIEITSANGTKRCDAKCYNALRPHCDCCCGGINHAVGLKQAQSNTVKAAQSLAHQFANDDTLTDWKIHRPPRTKFATTQLSLLDTAPLDGT